MTVDRLAEALGVEPGELANEEGVTILEEREGNTTRVIRRYDDFTLEISYDTSRLDEVTARSWRDGTVGRSSRDACPPSRRCSVESGSWNFSPG